MLHLTFSLAFGLPAHGYQGELRGARLVHCLKRACLEVMAREVAIDATGKIVSAPNATIRLPGSPKMVEAKDLILYMNDDLMSWTTPEGREDWIALEYTK